MAATWKINFVVGWNNTLNALALFGGGVAAVAVCAAVLALAMALLIGTLGAGFNCVTNALAKHWEKTDRVPSTRWAQIIAKGNRRRG